MSGWLQKRTNTVYMVSFLLMLLSPVPMYFALQGGQSGWAYFLLALFILGNVLLLLVR
jgi:hypothetical protein